MSRRRIPVTERSNPRTRRLDRATTAEILGMMSRENARVAKAVRSQLTGIARAVDAIAGSLQSGGRLFYIGSGTSGRLGVLDAAEIPPTFRFPAGRVVALIAGGSRALRRSVEGAEDSSAAGARDLRRKRLHGRDVVVGLAASGTTPYVVGAVEYARRVGAATIAVTCAPGSELARRAAISIAIETGPEVIAGSTRLKAGTAQKMTLNMLSTATMVRLGHVYRNWMVNVQMSNEKLRSRGRRILVEATGCKPARAKELIRASGGSLKTAIVMEKLGCTRREAERGLKQAGGHVAVALGER